MKKLLLLFACSLIISATAQNNANIKLQKNNTKKQSVREMDYKQSKVYKRQQERIKILERTYSNQTVKSGTRSGCFSYSYYDPYAYFTANSNPLDSIVTWAWDFGDGNSASDSTDQTNHYYYQPNGG